MYTTHPMPFAPALMPRNVSLFLLSVLLLALSACSPQVSISDRVQLILNTDTFEPASTFELRFEEPTARPEEVGRPTPRSPLVIQPALRGEFVWLSQRSGVFTPTEPPALDRSYRFSLRHGLLSTNGRPLRARLDRTLKTPPLALTHSAPRSFHATNASALPRVWVVFNADVSPARANNYIRFQAADGRTVPAMLQLESLDGRYRRSEQQTWRRRFEAEHALRTNTARDAGSGMDLPSATTSNCLVVTPTQPLPVANGWKLVLNRGLPASEFNARLPEAVEINIGDVTPFNVAGVTTANLVSSGKSVLLTFSKPLAPAVQASNVMEWVVLTPPAPRDADVGGNSIRIHGHFEPGTEVMVKAGLPSADGYSLRQSWSSSLSFEPVPPRIYLPAFESAQLSGGGRQFEIMGVNVPHVRVRAKLLDRHNLIHALRGYESYLTPSKSPWRGKGHKNFFRQDQDFEMYSGVDFEAVPGRTIYATNLTLTPQRDAVEKVALSWDQILGGRAFGAVFIDVESTINMSSNPARPGAQSLIQLTDLGLAWKRWNSNALVWVFSHTTGEPVAGVPVQVMTRESEGLAEGVTDTNGLATLKLDGNAEWLLAHHDEDRHAVKLGRGEGQIPLYNFELPIAWDPRALPHREVMLFSDRLTYRPGEVLHLKGIVRDRTEEGLAVGAAARAVLRCFDARERRWLETNLVLSSSGSLDTTVNLPNAGSSGSYRVELHLDGQVFTHMFQVQEFQPSAFEVKVQTQSSYRADEPVKMGITAAYLMGKRLSQAAVRWSIEVHDIPCALPDFTDYSFGSQASAPAELGRGPASFTLSGESRLSQQGELELEPAIAPNLHAPHPQRMQLSAEITDVNQQTIFAGANCLRHASDLYLGIKRFAGIFSTGQTVRAEVIAVRPDGAFPTQAVSVQVTLTRLQWLHNRIQSAGGAVSYRSELEKSKIAETNITILPPGTGASNENSVALFTLPEAGEYLLDAETVDGAGRRVLSSASLHVSGTDQVAWEYRNERQIELTPDQKKYAAGETATLLVKTPIAGRALVTVEREKVLRSFVVDLEANAPSIQIPLLESDAPNVFVSVLLLRGADNSKRKYQRPEYRLGYCQLQVRNEDTKLDVVIHTERPAYRPGEYVQVAVEVLTSTGEPEPDAEVTLYAVDEGILSLAAETSPDPHGIFHATQPLAVTTGISLMDLVEEDPEQRTFDNKGYLIGGGGKSMRQLRKSFIPCPLWEAALRTDAEGKTGATFKAPDSLTRYRLIAVTHSRRDRFGSGNTSIVINKPLMIEPALPRFANVGDQVVARAVVHNLTSHAGPVEVHVQFDDTVTSETGPRLLELKAHGMAVAEFPVEFKKAGTAKWIWKAQFVHRITQQPSAVRPVSVSTTAMDDFTTFADAVESTLPVGHVAPLLRENLAGSVEVTETNLLAAANPQLLEGDGTVTIRISNTRLSDLNEPVEHLLHYPYGCVEQTSSSLLPWLVLRDFQEIVPLGKTSAEMDAAIQAGVNRLLSMQTASGGLAYWPGGTEAMLWGSAYAALPLILARRAGAEMPGSDLDALLRYLSEQLRGASAAQSDGDLSAFCLALYALAAAGKAEPAYHELLFGKRAALSDENRALLALAIAETRGEATIVRELLAKRKQPKDTSSDNWFTCPGRQLALQLLAWCRLDPGAPQVERTVTDLMQERRNGHWITTQGNAWSLLALADYAHRVENATSAAAGSVGWGNDRRTFQLQGRPACVEQTFAIDPQRRHEPLRLFNPQGARLYAHVQISARSHARRQARQDHGYSMQRSYTHIDPAGQSQPLTQLQVGDSVLVTLQFDARKEARYLVIDDALPSIFEAVNPEFKDQRGIHIGQVRGSDYTSYRELRADRALFFYDYLPPGRYTLRYLARVRAAGKATAPSTKIEEMYHPERFGLTETVDLISTAAD